MIDYLEIRSMYHSTFAEEDKARRKAELKVLNQDFYEDLPYQIRGIMDNLRWAYRNQPWFEEAWEKYRKHVLDAGLGGKIKMPGFVFNEYIDRYVDDQEKKMKKELVHMETCDIEEIYHHGIKGQRWGVRRFQNEDGTLTAEGRARYGIDENGKMSNRLSKAADTNRKDASDLRKAAERAKTEKARKDLLDSADALERLAEQQESRAKMSKDGKKLYKQDKKDQKILDGSNAGNAIRAAAKTGAKYGLAMFVTAGAALVTSKLMVDAGNLEGAQAVALGSKVVNGILYSAGTVHMAVSAIKGANEKDKVLDSQK